MSYTDYLSRRTINRIYRIVEYYFEYPCDFGEVALHQIREELDSFYNEVDEPLELRYEELQRQNLSYSNYINDGD